MDKDYLNAEKVSDKAERACRQCGEDISHRISIAIFCSNTCKDRIRQGTKHFMTKKCMICGDEFDSSGQSHRKTTCSRDCLTKWISAGRNRVYKSPDLFFGPPSPKTCLVCKSIFLPETAQTIYCTKKCRSKKYRETESFKASIQRLKENPEIQKSYIKKYQLKNREAINKRARDRRQCPAHTMQKRLSCLLSYALRTIGEAKSSPTLESFGYSIKDFCDHIERQFTKGMTWENRKKWHIDHIVPISTARTKDDVIALNQLSNLRPMWAQDNLAKRDKRTHLI